MGRAWDTDKGGRDQWIAWLTSVMQECRRVLKPGGHMLIWALPRTSHWTAMAIEDAGFTIRDVITHHFGSGFPKSTDFAADQPASRKAGYRIPKPEFVGTPYEEGWGTAIKPSSENWILARKPLAESSIARNVLAHGTGALNIASTRVGTAADMNPRDFDDSRRKSPKFSGILNGGKQGEYRARTGAIPEGRWPPNTVLSCCGNDPHDADCPVRVLDSQSGMTKSSDRPRHNSGGVMKYGGTNSRPSHDRFTKTTEGFSDSGGASRFFPVFTSKPYTPEWVAASYANRHRTPKHPRDIHEDFVEEVFEPDIDVPWRYIPKASRRERNAGLEGMEERVQASTWGDIGPVEGNPRKPATGHVQRVQNHHPTVKSLALMQWLCRLITRPGGTILDPFTGSGSTGCAAVQNGFAFVGIEMNESYVEIARARIRHYQAQTTHDDLPLFADRTAAD